MNHTAPRIPADHTARLNTARPHMEAAQGHTARALAAVTLWEAHAHLMAARDALDEAARAFRGPA